MPADSQDKDAGGGGSSKPKDEAVYIRWLAYLARVKAIAAKSVAANAQGLAGLSFKSGALRYMAFTSDFGEAFRPTVPAWMVNASYGISVGYIGCSVVEAGFVSRHAGKPWNEVRLDVTQELVFQGLASLAVPFLIIHSAVHHTARYLKQHSVHLTRPMVAKWAPSGVGLACVPLMPIAVDEPCEHAVEYVFDHYVRNKPHAGEGIHSMHIGRIRSLEHMQRTIKAFMTE